MYTHTHHMGAEVIAQHIRRESLIFLIPQSRTVNNPLGPL